MYQILTAVSIERNFIISYNPCNLQLSSIQASWVSQSRWCCIKFIRHVFIKWGIKVCIRKIMHQLVFEYNYEDQCQKENLSKSFNDVTDGGLVLLIFFSHLVMVSSPYNLHTAKRRCALMINFKNSILCWYSNSSEVWCTQIIESCIGNCINSLTTNLHDSLTNLQSQGEKFRSALSNSFDI